MFRDTFQKGLFTVFYSAGINPLRTWTVQRRDGYIKRIYEPDSGMLVMEMRALNVTLHYITTPKDLKKQLGIRLPILNLLVKNINKYFSFEVKILDDSRMRRRFRCSNYLTHSTIQIYETTVPLSMSRCDWVLIYFNLAEFTRRCYDTNYLETERIQVNGNILLRRIFFSDQVIEYNNLPKSYQLSCIPKEPARRPPGARPPSPANVSLASRTKKKAIVKERAGSEVTDDETRTAVSVTSMTIQSPTRTSVTGGEPTTPGPSEQPPPEAPAEETAAAETAAAETAPSFPETEAPPAPAPASPPPPPEAEAEAPPAPEEEEASPPPPPPLEEAQE